MRAPLRRGARLIAAALLALCLGLLGPGIASAQLPTPDGPAPLPSPTDGARYERPDISDGGPAPTPLAGAWLLGDVDSGEVFTSHNPDTPLPTASVMKLLTALALEPELPDRERTIEATEDMAAVDGTKVGLLPGNDYTVDELFHAMLMSSANDAAYALGEAVGGQERALELMSATAAEIGLQDTTPRTTSGLDADGQATTVQDLMILSGRVLQNDYLMGISTTETFDFPGGTDATGAEQPGYQIQNHTQIAGEVEGGLGLKNGYTTAALGSYVAVAERDGRTLVATILNSQVDTRDAAVDLLDWGFAQSDPEAVGEVAMTPPPAPTPSPSAEGAQETDRGTPQASLLGSGVSPLTWAAMAALVVVAVVAGVMVGRSRRRTVGRGRH